MKRYLFSDVFRDKKVFITGHTGFKGSWLACWLTHLGADVYGYALPPPTQPSLFELLNLEETIHHQVADVRDYVQVRESIKRIQPDIIFHLAAQSTVGESYVSPLDTIRVNTMGTLHVMEAVREAKIAAALVMITSDKCYDNKEWLHGYREHDALGGHDPYSASKGAAEILISSWRNSFFDPAQAGHGVRLASARAGNVIGGGSWTKDQLVPDCIRDLQDSNFIRVRNPHATRPWQHVLDALGGYLRLGARLLDPSAENARRYCDAFNFGPYVSSNKPVSELVEKIIECWGSGSWGHTQSEKVYHESSRLSLSFDKAYHMLQWLPKWDFNETIARTVAWYKTALQKPSAAREITLAQISDYENDEQADDKVPDVAQNGIKSTN